MSDVLCTIKIKIKDYYPKLTIIPYNDYYCLISYMDDDFSIPLKNIENIIFQNEPLKINSDLTYNISLLSFKNKNFVGKSFLIIPYIRIIRVIEMKEIKYEQQIKLSINKEMKTKIFGPGISVGSIFLKFIIEINGIKSSNSNIILPNNNIKIIKNNSKYNNNNCNISSFIRNYTIYKKKEKIKTNDSLKFNRQSTKYSTNSSNEFINNHISISKLKQNKSKINYLCNPVSPFVLKSYNKYKSERLFKLKPKRNYSNSNYLSPKNNLKKIYNNQISNKNINLKKYCSKGRNNMNLKSDSFLPICFSEMSFREKEMKKHKTEKRKQKIFYSQEMDDNFIANKDDYKKNENNQNNNKSIDLDKKFNKTMNKLPKKTSSYKMNNISNIEKLEKKNSKTSNQTEKSYKKRDKKNSLKFQTTRSFCKSDKTKERNNKNEINKNKSSKSFDPYTNLSQNNFKDINFIYSINNQEDLKNNIVSVIDYFKEKNKELKQKTNKNITYADSKYLLYKDKIILENKKAYSLQSQNNAKDFKNFIHVKVNSKYNNSIFNKMSKVKIK